MRTGRIFKEIKGAIVLGREAQFFRGVAISKYKHEECKEIHMKLQPPENSKI